MPVTTSYPGIYIEELPSNTHTIVAAPTSITVFVGYAHPFKTPPANWNTAIELFSFTDYEREFGGFFSSDRLDNSLPNAVNEFFLNGGADAFVVALQPSYWDSSGNNQGFVAPATLSVGGITFTAREFTDTNHQLILTIKVSAASAGVADIILSYGPVSETFRKVTLTSTDGNFIEKIVGTAANPVSSLVTVSPTGASYPATFTGVNQVSIALGSGTPLPTSPQNPDPTWTTFSVQDFTPVFQQDSSLDKLSIFNLVLVPGISDNTIWSEAQAFAERKLAFCILDPPAQAAADPTFAPLPLMADLIEAGIIPKTTNGALYFPYLQSHDPQTNALIELSPSGFVAGQFAATDLNRGVWKAPAGLQTVLVDTIGVVARGAMTDLRQGTLNPKGVNCIREFPAVGSVVFGARTLVTENVSFEQWKYVPVRRTALFIEQSLYNSLGWVVFEPNDDPLWVAIRNTIEDFMLSLFNQGAFQGSTPSQAFQVKCDSSTTTQTDINNGIVNILVAFAPLKPAEFVIIKIAQLAGQVQA
jgi:phage tail sheath protein FI